jgi:D,D-heptose 1,7-bisphosphate phosphatase
MIKYDTIFLDRDGTLNFDPGYISSLDQFEFYDFSIPALKLLSDHGNRFCMVTNQSGVSRGLIVETDLNKIHDYIRNQFAENDIRLLDIYFCPDHPDNATDRRKPGIGMFIEAAEEHAIDLRKSLMIGDGIADISAGNELGMDTMLVLTGRGNQTKLNLPDSIKPTYIVKNIYYGAQLILEID